MSCQGVEVDDDKRPEGMGFFPSAVGERLRVKHMCDKTCDEDGLQVFMSLQPSLRKSVTCRPRSTSAGTVMIAGIENNQCSLEDMIRQKSSRGRVWAAFGSDGFHQKNTGAIRE